MDTNGTASSLGWQSSPSTRGSWDIVWNCLKTISLCAWISMCPNIRAPESGLWHSITDKISFVLLALLGPDFVVLLAFGQWQSARGSVASFRALGYEDWTITHAFYADMGGIHVQPIGWKSFPVNAKQLHYLIECQYMTYPEIREEEIKALGKADGLAKLITISQTLAFLVNIVARFSEGLAVTTLELTVLANIFCTLVTYLCWWKKPADIECVRILPLETSIEEILREAGNDANGEYRDTPMDFASRDEWSASLLWNYYVNILRHMGILRPSHLQYARPVQRFTSFNFPKPTSQAWVLLTLATSTAYTSFFIGAWSFDFPTEAESRLWRVVVLLQSSITISGGLFGFLWYPAPVKHKTQLQQRGNTTSGSTLSSIHRKRLQIQQTMSQLWDMPCNNEVTGRYPYLDIPLGNLLPTTILAVVYMVCRLAILTEDVVSLRSLPASAYQEVNWTLYLPWV